MCTHGIGFNDFDKIYIRHTFYGADEIYPRHLIK